MLKHWLGFLVMVSFVSLIIAGAIQSKTAAMAAATYFFLFLAIWVLRLFFRILRRLGLASGSKAGR